MDVNLIQWTYWKKRFKWKKGIMNNNEKVKRSNNWNAIDTKVNEKVLWTIMKRLKEAIIGML